MNLHFIDWCIVAALLIGITVLALYTNRYLKSVADFLVANRAAGRYMLAIAGGASAFATIGAIASFEVYYKAGFPPIWWGMMHIPVSLIIVMTGWAVYRFRQTRAMTIAQFLEVRYSRRLRIFSGLLAYLSGIINFGIFPAVSANFFIYFCGFPAAVTIFGFHISTFVLLMLILLGLAFFYTFAGGQITIMVIDFVQGWFCFISFIVIAIFLMTKFSWQQIGTAMSVTGENASLIHPFHTGKIKDFNIWYFLIGVFGMIMNVLGWQGNMGYGGAARSPHEARMAGVVGSWRGTVYTMFIVMLPIFAYTFMHHPEFVSQAQSVTAKLDTINDPITRFQMIVPMVLTSVLPTGFLGIMCAVMLAAFIANHNSYLHSWGSIFVQDIILPLRKTPLTPKQHILLLRCSILGVGIFIFFFSLLFKQTEHIVLFMAITGAIFLGGSGPMLIGGLYWKRGSTSAAWSALIVGSTLAVGGMVMQQLASQHIIPKFPINGQWMFFISMLTSLVVYVVISLLSNTCFDMDKLLHRGQYAVASDVVEGDAAPARGWRALLTMGKEFSRGDRILFIITFAWGLFWGITFIIGTIYNLIYDVKQESWFAYWRLYILLFLVIAIVVTIWVGIGGLRDMKALFVHLASAKHDHLDDGSVLHQQKLE
jgi:SSS family solute:Na+ symporter